MRNLLAALAILGGLAVSGCDTRGEFETAKLEYNGKVTVRMIKEVHRFTPGDDSGSDQYRFEILDSLGNRLGYLTGDNQSVEGKVFFQNGKTYTVGDEGVKIK